MFTLMYAILVAFSMYSSPNIFLFIQRILYYYFSLKLSILCMEIFLPYLNTQHWQEIINTWYTRKTITTQIQAPEVSNSTQKHCTEANNKYVWRCINGINHLVPRINMRT